MTLANSWLTVMHPRPAAAMRLFCFPGAGAGGAAFRPWGPLLGDDVEVNALEWPGHWKRRTEPLLHDMPTLVAAAGEALLPHFDKPFAFFGFSMGALVSFALTRWLRERGAPLPRALIVAGRFSPTTPGPATAPVGTLSDEAFASFMGRAYGLPPGFSDDADLVKLMLPVMRADMQVLESFKLTDEAPLPLPITVLAGERDPSAPRDSLDAWQALSAQPIDVRLFPGVHHFIESQTPAVVQAVKAAIQP